MNVAVPPKKPRVSTVEDVQGHPDTRQIPINKVGIKDIYHPVRVKDRANGEQHTVANFNMYVNLPHNFKGTHMSRFVEILHRHEREISVDSFGKMLEEMTGLSARRRGPHRDDVPLFRHEEGPGVGRREPDELPGHHIRRASQRQDRGVAQGGGADHEPMPVLEEDLRLRRAQSALAHHADRASSTSTCGSRS